MIDDWKICLTLDNDSCTGEIFEKECEEHPLPFLPHVGDVLWPSADCTERLTNVVKECWRKKRCRWCPYIYCAQESEDDIDVQDYIYVRQVCHDVDNKVVRILLDNERHNDEDRD